MHFKGDSLAFDILTLNTVPSSHENSRNNLVLDIDEHWSFERSDMEIGSSCKKIFVGKNMCVGNKKNYFFNTFVISFAVMSS